MTLCMNVSLAPRLHPSFYCLQCGKVIVSHYESLTFHGYSYNVEICHGNACPVSVHVLQ